ncbi:MULTISPECIES: DUF6153 family protein [Kitasatospora]|uniref:Secreted protein n=1 Tax=Kitasatospora cystarginea TaxID=58350 RepID=A0ABN3E3B9_9ACTN
MDTLTPRHPVAGRRRSAGVRALTVLALLFGLLAMHALADPVDAVAHPQAHERRSAAQFVTAARRAMTDRAMTHRATTQPVVAQRTTAQLTGNGDGRCDCDGRHQAHAGSVCQASGLGSTPVLPPLRPCLGTSAHGPSQSPADASVGLTTGRGPPSLAALQLLRI